MEVCLLSPRPNLKTHRRPGLDWSGFCCARAAHPSRVFRTVRDPAQPQQRRCVPSGVRKCGHCLRLQRCRPDRLDAPDTDTYARTYVQGRPTITTVTATEARKQLYKLLDDVSNSHEPVQITGKRGNAVLIGEDDWRAVQETLYLVSIPGMRESIIEGIGTPVEELDGELRW